MVEAKREKDSGCDVHLTVAALATIPEMDD